MGYSATPGAIIRIGVDGAAASRREIDTVARTMSNLSATVQSAMRNLAASLGLGAGIAQVIQMSDEYAKFTAQLRLATQGQREYGIAYADVKRIAKDSQQGLAETGVLYARIANGTRELGTSQRQVADITEVVNMALKVSGATTAEAASAQLQLSQAFASGTLRGEEFNAVNEAAPRLMLALADGIGVPVGALKKMAENGLITSKVMADVLPKALGQLREEAKQVQTIAGAFTVLKNNMMEVFALKAEANGTVGLLTAGIGLLAANLDVVTSAMGGVLAMKVANYFFAGVAAVQAYMAKNAELAALVVVERAALVARAQAQVTSTAATLAATGATLAETEATLAGLVAQRATIVALRESAVAQLAKAQSSIASAEATMAAASAAGAQSFALRTLRLATMELAAAEQARAAAMAEIAALGVAQSRISAQITAATTAQTAAAAANVTATTAQAAAMAGAAGAASRTATALGLASRALGLLGGPIGLITTLLGVGAAAWMMWGNKGSEAEKKVTETLADEIDGYLANLNKQIEKLKERNELAGKGMTTGAAPTSDGDKKREQIMAEINRISKQTDLSVDAKTEILRVWGARLNAVTEDMEKFAAAQQKSKDLAFAAKYDEWLGKNGSAAQKIKYELEELRKEYGQVTPEMEKFVRAKYADKGAAAKVKEEATAYTTLMTAVREKIAANQLEAAGYSSLTDAQKMTIQLDAAIATGKNKLSKEHIAEARAQIATVAVQDTALLSAKNVAKAVQELADDRNNAYSAAVAEAQANEELVATYGMTKLQIEQLTLARLEDRLAQRASLELDAQEVAQLERMIAAKKRNVAAVGKLDTLEQGTDVAKAKELLDIMTALDEVTRSAAAGMAESFGRVGSAIGDVTTALSGYGRTQAAIAAQLAADKRDAKSDPVKLKAAEMKASDAAAVAQVRQYGDMAKAAKGFFKENTAGYKVMEGAEKAFRAYEMAMSVKNMVEKSGLLMAFTGLFVASKATETAVEGTATAASVGMAGTQASAWGVTAVVKAIASLPFPWNLAAGAATLAAVIAAGAAMMGSVGSASSVNVNSAEERQKVQGTGTVLGDPTAKSESMAKSLSIMEKYAELGLGYQNSMLIALRNIETSLGGAAKGIMQTAGITSGSAFGTKPSSDDSLFGASHTKDITDSGIKLSGTFGQLRAGQGSARQYEDVFTTSDGGMFHSGWERTDTNYKALSAEAMKPFALIYDNMGDLMVDAGTKLGYDSKTLTDAINNTVINFGVSLRGLTGDDLTAALNAGVSASFDKLASDLFPFVDKYQKIGEGLGETLVRMAADVQAVDSVFAAMGKTANISMEAKEILVQAAGGMEKFADSASSFMSNFYTDAEQLAMTKARLAPVLATVGLTTEGANAQTMFRDFVLGLDTSTAAGAKTYAMLMDVQQAFKDVTSAAADQCADLLAEWDDLTLTDAEKRAKERLAIDPANQALFDQITLQRELKSATDGASGGLQDVVDRLTATKTSTMAYLDSLVLGSLSTLTPMQKYLETQRQYNAAVNKAMADPTDSSAASAAQTAATTFLTASQVINASSAAFIGDKSKVMSDMDRLAAFAGSQLTDAQRQLSALDKQTAGLTQLNGTAAAIEQAILSQGAPTLIAAAPAFDVQRYAASSSASADVLATEVKALRAEVAGQREINAAMLAELKQLRTDAKRNADDIVDATEGVGETVSKEVETALEQAVYMAANPTRMKPR